MKSFSIFFLLGILSIYFFEVLPPLLPIGAVAVLLLASSFFKTRYRHFLKMAAAMSLGCFWVMYASQQVLSWHLPENKTNVPVSVTGKIVSIPVVEEGLTSFLFQLSRFEGAQENPTIKLAFYPTQKQVTSHFDIGQHWQFTVKLKPPHTLNNPGSFDREQFDFENRIRASGYILAGHELTLCTAHPSVGWDPAMLEKLYGCQPSLAWGLLQDSINHLRSKIFNNLQTTLAGKPYAAFIEALTVGEKSGISQSQWQVFQNTGTNHLMAIAGLHIGFVAGILFFLVNWIWKRFPKWLLHMPSHQAAAIGSLFAAILYAALSGFALPTQRALVMLTVFLLSLLCRRFLTPFQGVALALIIVLFLDPLSVLTISFWLSFGAIVLIAFGLSARFSMKSFWWQHGRMQWVVSLGIIPLTMLFFSNASLISPIANSLVIPLVGFVTIPIALCGALLSLVSVHLAYPILVLAEWSVHPVFWILEKLSSMPYFAWQHVVSQPIFILPALFGILLLLAPRGIPHRYLGLLFIAPLCLSMPRVPPAGTVWINLLEVGQGLSAVVQTTHHTLVFDTGPKLSESYDAGRMVLVPFLEYQGISKIDRLVISHPHEDHIGGAQALLQAYPGTAIVTSSPDFFPHQNAELCMRGQSWNWDGVSFTFLHPSPSDDLTRYNNSSCVLKIALGENQILMTGDIEAPAEAELLTEGKGDLRSTLMLVPHHGSKTSSTELFLQAVSPTVAFIPAGYLNRFHFPDQIVLDRYRAHHVTLYDTAQSGRLFIAWNKHSPEVTVHEERERKWHIWNT